MGKRLRWNVIIVKDTLELTLTNKVVSVSIHCQNGSANDLLVGLNQDANSQNILQAGESMPLGPYSDGSYLDQNELRLGFQATDPSNGAVVIITTEVDNNYC